MSTDEVDVQKLATKAASLLLKAPILTTVPQAMCAAKFSDAQSTNPALQMRVRRMLSNNKKEAYSLPPVGVSVDISSPMPTVSTLSSPPVDLSAITPSVAEDTSTSTTTETTIVAKPKLDRTRLTATARAKEDTNKKCHQPHMSAAVKRATKLL